MGYKCTLESIHVLHGRVIDNGLQTTYGEVNNLTLALHFTEEIQLAESASILSVCTQKGL